MSVDMAEVVTDEVCTQEPGPKSGEPQLGTLVRWASSRDVKFFFYHCKAPILNNTLHFISSWDLATKLCIKNNTLIFQNPLKFPQCNCRSLQPWFSQTKSKVLIKPQRYLLCLQSLPRYICSQPIKMYSVDSQEKLRLRVNRYITWHLWYLTGGLCVSFLLMTQLEHSW